MKLMRRRIEMAQVIRLDTPLPRKQAVGGRDSQFRKHQSALIKELEKQRREIPLADGHTRNITFNC